MNERMAEVIDDLVDELRLGAEMAAERDESRKQEHALVAKRLEEVTKSHSMNLKAAKADIARVTKDEIAKLDKVNEERARDLAATVLASEQVLSIRVEEGVERNASEVKAAVEAARAKEEAARAKDIVDVAMRKSTRRRLVATARAASLEGELAAALERLELELVGARGETAKIRREFEETAHTRAETRAAAEASAAVREVAKLQKRLLAAAGWTRGWGWRETQRSHAARMENMAAKLVEYTLAERRLSDELHERGVQLELERRNTLGCGGCTRRCGRRRPSLGAGGTRRSSRRPPPRRLRRRRGTPPFERFQNPGTWRSPRWPGSGRTTSPRGGEPEGAGEGRGRHRRRGPQRRSSQRL